jgi:hypothetical protein
MLLGSVILPKAITRQRGVECCSRITNDTLSIVQHQANGPCSLVLNPRPSAANYFNSEVQCGQRVALMEIVERQ